MKILFDLINTQFQYSGGAEYIRRVFYSCLSKLDKHNNEVLCLIDSSINSYAYKDLSPEVLECKGIRTIDIYGTNLSSIVHNYKIDKVFIGVAQVWGSRYDLRNVDCEVICVVHDLCDQEFENSRLNHLFHIDDLKYMSKYVIKKYLKHDMTNHRMDPIIRLFHNNPRTKFITVSNYSKTSIVYNFGLPEKRIDVCYSPERVMEFSDTIENKDLKNIIERKSKFYLLTNVHREAKNAQKMLKAFYKYSNLIDNDSYIVTTGVMDSFYDKHIALPFLSESDLANAYMHCYAFLFPSYFEGFGYPPMEAMKFGKPVLASNTSSMPEILGDAPIYFSPIYETDMFRCLCFLNEHVYEEYINRSEKRYLEVSKRQNSDLEKLTHIILD